MRVRRRAFSPFSTQVLISAFAIDTCPSKEQREAIAAAIGTTERRVQVWFQNRRQRESSRSTAARDSESSATNVEDPLPVATVAVIEDSPASEVQGWVREDSTSANEEVVQRLLVPSPGKVSEGCPTPDMKMETFTSLYAPYEVLWSSADWLSFCGFTDSEVAGQVATRHPRYFSPFSPSLTLALHRPHLTRAPPPSILLPRPSRSSKDPIPTPTFWWP